MSTRLHRFYNAPNQKLLWSRDNALFSAELKPPSYEGPNEPPGYEGPNEPPGYELKPPSYSDHTDTTKSEKLTLLIRGSLKETPEEWCLTKLGVTAPVKVKFKSMKHYGMVQPKKNHYKLTISTKAPDPIRTLFHECVHIKQFEHDGLIVPAFRGEVHTGSYWWAPWEIEARGLEDALIYSWRKECTRKQRQKHLKHIQKLRLKSLQKA